MFGFIKERRLLIEIVAMAILYLGIIVGQLVHSRFLVGLLPLGLAVVTAATLIKWQIRPKAKVFIAIVMLISIFALEILQVNNSFIGATKTYGDDFGIKLLGVSFTMPLIILVIIVSAWQIVSAGKLTTLKKFITGGLIVLMSQLVLESFASSYGFWQWSNPKAPLLSYFIWLILAEVYFYLFYRYWPLKKADLFAISTLPVMAIFFWLMMAVR